MEVIHGNALIGSSAPNALRKPASASSLRLRSAVVTGCGIGLLVLLWPHVAKVFFERPVGLVP